MKGLITQSLCPLLFSSGYLVRILHCSIPCERSLVFVDFLADKQFGKENDPDAGSQILTDEGPRDEALNLDLGLGTLPSKCPSEAPVIPVIPESPSVKLASPGLTKVSEAQGVLLRSPQEGGESVSGVETEAFRIDTGRRKKNLREAIEVPNSTYLRHSTRGGGKRRRGSSSQRCRASQELGRMTSSTEKYLVDQAVSPNLPRESVAFVAIKSTDPLPAQGSHMPTQSINFGQIPSSLDREVSSAQSCKSADPASASDRGEPFSEEALPFKAYSQRSSLSNNLLHQRIFPTQSSDPAAQSLNNFLQPSSERQTTVAWPTPSQTNSNTNEKILDSTQQKQTVSPVASAVAEQLALWILRKLSKRIQQNQHEAQFEFVQLNSLVKPVSVFCYRVLVRCLGYERWNVIETIYVEFLARCLQSMQSTRSVDNTSCVDAPGRQIMLLESIRWISEMLCMMIYPSFLDNLWLDRPCLGPIGPQGRHHTGCIHSPAAKLVQCIAFGHLLSSQQRGYFLQRVAEWLPQAWHEDQENGYLRVGDTCSRVQTVTPMENWSWDAWTNEGEEIGKSAATVSDAVIGSKILSASAWVLYWNFLLSETRIPHENIFRIQDKCSKVNADTCPYRKELHTLCWEKLNGLRPTQDQLVLAETWGRKLDFASLSYYFGGKTWLRTQDLWIDRVKQYFQSKLTTWPGFLGGLMTRKRNNSMQRLKRLNKVRPTHGS